MRPVAIRDFHVVLPVMLLLTSPLGAQTGVNARGWGLSVSGAVSAAPLGQLAERTGLSAIPGGEYGFRVLWRTSPASEWSAGFLADDYGMDLEIDPLRRFQFDYSSTALVAGYVRREVLGGVPLLLGVDGGWRWFEAHSTVPSYYTGEMESSQTRGGAALAAVSFGIEVPLTTTVFQPRVRLETNYPDLGGGDGYSGLHREHGLGFRASIGADLKRLLLW